MKNLMIAFGLLFCLSGAVLAEETAQNNDSAFANLDTNKDGALSKDELGDNAILTKNFDSLDTDKSSTLSKDEYNAINALTDVSQ